MPYIAIKSYPKEEEKSRELVERINQVLLEVWGCPQRAVTISMEQIPPEEWEERVVKPEILPNKEKMLILDGEKSY